MTDRIKGFTVLLDEDLREDDAESLRSAILHMRGVENVTGVVVDVGDWMARERVKSDVRKAIFDLLIPNPPRR